MRTLFLALLVVLTLSACSQNDNAATTTTSSTTSATSELANNTPKGQASVKDDANSILKIAIGSKDHTTLVAAVQAAGIEHILVNAGPLTVFAPTNAAFDKLPAGTVEELVKPENKAKLTGILTSHAAPGTFDIKQLKKEAKKGRKVYTAAGDYLAITMKGDDIYVEGAKVLGEVRASNGVVVVVDNIISPKK